MLLPWLPEDASREAGRIDFVFWFTIGICIVIFAIVVAVLVYSIVKFRAKPDDDSDGPPIHGHTGLEIVWTLIPTLLVTSIGIVSAIVLGRNDAQGKDVFRVNVTAQQFAWSFTYPEAKNLTSGVLRLPVGRSVELSFQSLDVIHSFWVPEFGQKQDTVPGLHDAAAHHADEDGHVPRHLHRALRARPRDDAHRRDRHDARRPSTSGSRGRRRRRRRRTRRCPAPRSSRTTPCGSCHTLAAAGATGKVGPDLDKLPQWATHAKQPLEQFIRTSITEPNAYTQPGFPKNVMPPFASLPKAQLDALVQYLIQSSKKG